MAQQSSEEKKTTVLITGANKGIGLELAKICLEDHDNIELIVSCRNIGRIVKYDSKKSQNELNKDPDYWECMEMNGKVNVNWNDGKHTRKEILKEKFDYIMKNSKYSNNSIDFIELDINTGKNNNNDEKISESYLNARNTINNSLKYIKEKYGTIDILVNNAGYAQKGPAFDFDIVTRTNAINYYGTKYLTELYLLNNLINKKNGKIIFVSSQSGKWAFNGSNNNVKNKFEEIVIKGTKNNLDEFMDIFVNAVKKDSKNVKYENFEFASSGYGMSKAVLSMYTRLLERDLTKEKITIGIGAYCPGYCKSYMTSGGGNRTSKDGARGIELLCFKQKLDGNNNGKFWEMEMSNNNYKLIHTPWKEYMHM